MSRAAAGRLGPIAGACATPLPCSTRAPSPEHPRRCCLSCRGPDHRNASQARERHEMSQTITGATRGDTPVITELRVVPVAGRDAMLLNLSGAHGPFFTRNVVLLRDNA